MASVSIGDWDEGTLARFIEDVVDGGALSARMRALQGGVVHRVGDVGEPAFANAWVNYDAAGPTARDARFYLAGRRCFLEGVIKNGTVGLTAFTLPVGFRPLYSQVNFAVQSNGAFGAITVDSAGNVIPSTGSNVFFFLDGISFRVA